MKLNHFLILLLLCITAQARTLQQLQQWNGGYYWDATASTWHQHSNGGCWVQNTASVDSYTVCDDTAIVAGSAVVVTSELRLQAWVRDFATVTSAKVDKYASVSGHASLYGGIVTDHATLNGTGVMYSSCGPGCSPALTAMDYALVGGELRDAAQASGHSFIYPSAVVKNSARIKDNAVVNGAVTVQDSAQVTGCSVVASFPPDAPIVISGTTIVYTSCH